MLPVVTAAEMRELDRMAIEEIGLPGAVLMETAGRKLASAVLSESDADVVAVICGHGNNGGDGFVCARVLREHGVIAVAYLASAEELISGDAKLFLAAYRECGGVVVSIAGREALASAEEEIICSDVVVDALLGTGLVRDVEGHFADVVDVINDAVGSVIACDIPSGLCSDTGHPLGACVRADTTVTMALPKIGLLTEPGFTFVGDLHVVEIGIPVARAAFASVGYFSSDDAEELLPWPGPTDHKNRRGCVVVIGGQKGQRGAAKLAARSAFAAGAGLVVWASPSQRELDAPDPIMTEAIDRESEISSWLAPLLERADAVVLGPGMPSGEWGRAVVAHVVGGCQVPLLIDAAALGHLAAIEAGSPVLAETAGREIVVTPHPGEAGTLLGKSSSKVQADRLSSARALSGLGTTAVLKGARTIVSSGPLSSITGTGNAGMATAGSGDVLAGLIGGFLAQGLAAGDGARLGVYLHGLAGDLAAEAVGPLSMTAEDVLAAIPEGILRLVSEVGA